MTTRAAIYARVSSAAQRERHTIENQLRVLPDFVKSQGWDLVGTYTDDGRSAKTGQLEKRDGFASLMRSAERGEYDIIVVVDVDRLTRTDSMEERALILGPFQRLGIQIATPTGGMLDMRTMLGELWVTIQALGAAAENAKRIERIKAGKARSIAENRKPSGPTPYGLLYSKVTGAWSIDEKAATLVREMFRRIGDGEPCVRVAEDFTRRGEHSPWRSEWTRAMIYRLLRSTHLRGEWVVNKKTLATIKVPAVITDAEWSAAFTALGRAQRRGLNRTKHVYLLASLATCACGAGIYVRSGVKYFNAQHEEREHPAAYFCSARKVCRQPIVRVRDADDRVWAAICERLEAPDLIAELAEVGVAHAEDGRAWEADIATHTAHLARLVKVEAAIMSRFRHGKISEEALDLELAALGRERAAVREQLETAQRATHSTESAQARLHAASVLVEQLRCALPLATPEQRHALVRELVRATVIENGEIRLELRIVRPAQQQIRAPIGLVTTSSYRSQHGADGATMRICVVA